MSRPVPIERQRARGNPSKRKLPDQTTTAAVARIDAAPDTLSEVGQATWEAIKSTAPWIANTDGGALLLLCEKLERRAAMLEKAKTEPFTIVSDNGMVRSNPLFTQLSDLENDIVKLYGILGLTPTDRARLGVAEVRTQSTLEKLRNARMSK